MGISKSTQITVQEINHPLHAFILGNVLGDGSLTKRGRLTVEQKEKFYTSWKFEYLQKHQPDVLPDTTNVAFVQRIHPKTEKESNSYRFTTKSCFEDWRKEFYKSNLNSIKSKSQKTLPLYLETIFKDPLSLAVWFMDDGGKGGNTPYGLIISAARYTDTETQLLIQCLKNNFDISATLQAPNSSKQLYIPKTEFEKFRNIVLPYCIDAVMKRKIDFTP